LLTRLPARWPLAVVMKHHQAWFSSKLKGLGYSPLKLFPLKGTPPLAAGFFIV
jgi:hypothetical protein